MDNYVSNHPYNLDAPRYVLAREIEAKAAEYYDDYDRRITCLAERVFNAKILPFLKKRGWSFFNGNGTWFMGNDEGYYEEIYEVWYNRVEGIDDPELEDILALLEVEVLDTGNGSLSLYMPNYEHEGE
jgi:hypothetical protein